MDNAGYFLAGISAVVSILMIAVSARSYQKAKSRFFSLLLVVFVLIFFDSLYAILSGLGIFQVGLSLEDILLLSNLLILALFYFAAIR
ncbi:MAG TPA: hypothetical protein VKU79_04480 [Thermoplasmataceae archaeon]|nr:hypothetical protein [Thermoplasmatales archaeon AK]HLH86101.1 hypothetical protein [Thermoplasmataceae archaeon]